ncbi:TonB-dependent siderophore receptor [Mangrovimonas sp. ST2L15]|uniref:TonB-dependent receptor plug domain-containing protein n=1 Tax=Mangrovimonas sp. ST2L15 TaxID=1645916 RepID=UPI001E435332|nr:TonB-dependent receptor plug domain-containing protein [Mangrovimonas sp. ST2L15]
MLPKTTHKAVCILKWNSRFTTVLFMFFGFYSWSQEVEPRVSPDTLNLQEVIVLAPHKLNHYKQDKPLSSIDDYLEKAQRVGMIKRGRYAWEPSLNNMTSERLNVTIDGMYVFGACTDKMDPITSYVDVSNIEQVTISSGQEGTEHGHNIGGAIDLKFPEAKYGPKKFKSSLDLGYETNGNYKTTGMDLAYTNTSFYLNLDGIYRHADNYEAGGQEEVLYSQFEKYNVSGQMGYLFNAHHALEAHFIYDKATDVGYPALPMDVSLAEALIGSIGHNYQSDSTLVKQWETKLYANTVTHIMDDSQRVDVPIRMDMPGWSDTYGFYSKLQAERFHHDLSLNLNGYYNRSLAEMTMYPNDSSQPSMFMYTWPDVRTWYTGLYVEDRYRFTPSKILSASMRLGYQNNRVANDEGLESLKIFYPNMGDDKNRMLFAFSSNYHFVKKDFDAIFGLGYGERAPSVSEGYGFYLFNSFDRFDYIGNPNLANEKSLEAQFKTNYRLDHFQIGLEASYFHIKDYVIGEIDPNLSAMTIGANGVKQYSALDYATIFDVYLHANFQFFKRFLVHSALGYNYGKGSHGGNLPLIKPFSYIAEVSYTAPYFNVAIQLQGNGNQSRYGYNYGEDETPAYGILNMNLGHVVPFHSNKLVFKYGIENVLDTYYSTYADWNNIPREGRNFYINLSVVMN